jgi:hypothetical protein
VRPKDKYCTLFANIHICICKMKLFSLVFVLEGLCVSECF